jgi:hypothetical protein
MLLFIVFPIIIVDLFVISLSYTGKNINSNIDGQQAWRNPINSYFDDTQNMSL